MYARAELQFCRYRGGGHVRRYYSEINAVRFASAVLVLFHHLAFTAWAEPGGLPHQLSRLTQPLPGLGSWGWFGWVGVEVFFVISGVVIANSAADRTVLDFIRGRVVRLYPAAIVCSAIAAGLLLWLHATPPNFPRALLNSMFLIPVRPWLDPVFWTLSVEIVFYALTACWLMQKRVGFETFAIGLVGWSALWVVLDLTGNRPAMYWERITLLRHACFFALGMLLWAWSVGRLTWRGKVAAALGSALGLYEIFSKTLAGADGWGVLPYYPFMPAAVWAVSVLAIAYSLWAGSQKPSVILKQAGLATYPLYLSHTTIGGAAIFVLTSLGLSPGASFALACLAAILAAWAIAVHVEPPVAKFLRNILSGQLWR
nr:acyltransferase [Microbacterium terregens]